MDDLITYKDYYQNRLLTAIYALNDKKVRKYIPDFMVVDNLISYNYKEFFRNEEEIKKTINDIIGRILKLIDYLTKKYRISTAEIERELE